MSTTKLVGQRLLLLVALVTLVWLLVQPAQIFASAANRPMVDGVEDILRAIAEASIAAQNQVLVTGDIEGALANDPLAPFYKDAIWDRLVYAWNQRLEPTLLCGSSLLLEFVEMW